MLRSPGKISGAWATKVLGGIPFPLRLAAIVATPKQLWGVEVYQNSSDAGMVNLAGKHRRACLGNVGRYHIFPYRTTRRAAGKIGDEESIRNRTARNSGC